MAEETQKDNGEVSEPSPQEAVSQLRELFTTLVPPETLELRDAFGNTHLVRATIPARSQIKVMQQLDSIWGIDTSEITMSEGMGGIGGISNLIIKLCSNEVLFESICGAFEYAHPRAFKDAQKSAIACGVDAEDTKHVADLFPVEEIVAGLIPFFIRLASRAVNLMNQVTSQPEQEATT